MPTFKCAGYHPVQAPDAAGAAAIFAARQARAKYGKAGFCRSLHLNSWTEDGRSHDYQAFIGKPVPGEPGATRGIDVWLTVQRVVGGAR